MNRSFGALPLLTLAILLAAGCKADADGDGYTADVDCDDEDPYVGPDQYELCNGIDDDCDGQIDEDDAVDAPTWFADGDGDCYGNPADTLSACSQPEGYVGNGDDCADDDAGRNPDADEMCDGTDNDCDGLTDEEDAIDATTYYADFDGDGFGDPYQPLNACSQPTSYVLDASDCDDEDPLQHPGADEVCNNEDDDCDGDLDEDAIDSNTWYYDNDGDGFGDPNNTVESCSPPSGYVGAGEGMDCDDYDDSQHPFADEYCNGEDDDCDGEIDEEALDGDWFVTDADGDGFGAPGTTEWACEGVDNEWDCDDTDATEPVVVDTDTGSSTGPGTLSYPYDQIQDGIDVATQCVVVYQGTYTENIDFDGKDLAVTGVEGADLTFIDCSDAIDPTVTFSSGEGSGAVLSGFTITGGSGHSEESSDSWACSSVTTCYNYYTTWCGGGIYVDGSDPTLTELVVQENELPAASSYEDGDDTYYEYSYGGGLCFVDSNSALAGVDVYENYADQGGGIYLDEDSILTMGTSWITDNAATDGAGIEADGGDLTLTNVGSTWNAAIDDGGGLLALDAAITATNVTWGSDSATNGVLYLAGASQGTIMNSIVFSGGVGLVGDSGATFAGTYNNVFAGTAYSGITDPTGTDGNIASDPEFVDVSDDGAPYNDDWGLDSTVPSPSIDAGNPDSSYYDVDGSTNDQGAFGGPEGDWE